MLVRESMDAYIAICTVAKSSIFRSSHPIPSVEFFPTDNSEDEGKLFVHSQPSEVRSHHRYECEQTLDGGGTRTYPSLRWYEWRWHRPLWP
jgi:hypothetical protein